MKKRKIPTDAPITYGLMKSYVGTEIRASELRLHARCDALSRAIVGLEKNMNERFDRVFSTMDAFIKRTENNALEITFLGRQHDDLAKYCTQKIGYPTYGRNL